MIINNLTLILLSISVFADIALIILISKSVNKSQIKSIFTCNLICLFICCFGQVSQILLSKEFNIKPVYFDYFVYIGTCFLPVTVFLTGLIFYNNKIKLKKIHLLLLIIPIISLLVLWTNDFHHLFYKKYSINISETVYGSYMLIHNMYSYMLLGLGIFFILKSSIKSSGFFSKQSLLIVLGISIPAIVSILGTLKIIPMTIYMTPISFTIAIVLFSISIIKFQFLGVTPIALQKIVNVMSDCYLVLDTSNAIVDYNNPFLKAFNLKDEDLRNKNIFQLFNTTENLKNFKQAYQNSIKYNQTNSIEFYHSNMNKYFIIEISPLYNKLSYIGALILFKNITQHKIDMETIKNNQDTLMERERLASLGQLIGGIAHNLKTPIMSIAGAAEGLTDLVKEYDNSIDDPEVTSLDHHDIAKDMTEWISKIKTHTEYMSDIITAVKGQAVTLNNETDISFTIGELLKRVNILMKHELKNAIIYLEFKLNTDENTIIHGDINSLVQVINNMISNSIQSYNGKPNEKIDLIVNKENNNLIISIKDYGMGIPEKVKEKLFKEMITTKGKNGTGLGLYMSYSTIKAHFNGNITIDSLPGNGCTFNIILPL